ncbi:class III lanthionine synthetase LanKC [Streptomyces sp. 796.1]|uniref:class III lanthionine synthetase LanKC n=1 Tax=Streptomyces sp. 796.1 TaxID=3163029 RepID=UPI0039C8C0C0
MDKRYEVYCLADRFFYETPDRFTRAQEQTPEAQAADGQPEALPTAPDAATEAGTGAAAGVEAGAAAGTDGAPRPPRPARGTLFEAAQRPAPEGWRRQLVGDWLHYHPVDAAGAPRVERPLQGWKIHVSACLDNADKTAAKVWDYCVAKELPFKLIPGPSALHLRNSKYAGRGSSGKFFTLYPLDEAELHATLTALGELLEGEPGPYVLSDLRWGEGPLYVRYGGFAPRYCVDDAGALVPAIEDPTTGQLVPDRRDPAFHTPPWVRLPEFLAPHLAARNATTTADLPYRIERALHFSNGGGVYAGTDTRTGEQVVLKEARPFAGLAADGADAVQRLEREKTALERLTGLGVAPGVRDWFELGDHRFLVMDFVPGRPLNSFFAQRHPLLAADPDPAAVADYTAWALRVHAAVEAAVAAVHGRGVVFNDLHMFNIMVAPDDETVRLIDFEAAAHIDEGRRQSLAHPGFMAPTDRRGFAVDHYALACLRLALFVPMTTLFVLDRGKAAHLAEIIADRFPVPAAFLAEAVAVIGGTDAEAAPSAGASAEAASGAAPPDAVRLTVVRSDAVVRDDAAVGGETAVRGDAVPTTNAPAAPGPERRGYLPVEPADWPRSRDSIVAAMLASASPDRADRLFPGDVAQFGDGGGLGVAHGAAGVLYAMDQVGAARYPDGEQWLLTHTDPPPPGTPLGFYDGLMGVAYVLDRLGHRDRAVELAGRVLDENWQRLVPDLYGGVAGVGLALDALARSTGESTLHDRALEAAELLARQYEPTPDTAEAADGGGQAGAAGRPRGRAGLLYGASGPALLFLRLYEHRGDPALLDLAERALRRDLDRCVTDRHGTLVVDERIRTMPYLGAGSVGIGMVLDSFLAHRDDERLRQARDAIAPAAQMRYYAQPGLFNGRAGMIVHLSRTAAGAAHAPYAEQAADPAPGAARPDGAAPQPAAPPTGRAQRPFGRQLADQIAELSWYAMPYRGQLAFPGDQMMRLSMDLGTGGAGCLLALGAALHPEPAALPFLPPLRRP